MTPIACPKCAKKLRAPPGSSGHDARCSGCGTVFTIPPLPPPESEPLELPEAGPPPPPLPPPEPAAGKYCHECGARIKLRAEICPKCGVRQPVRDDDESPRRQRPSRDSFRVPLLISAISNIVVGLIWAATCFGVVFTIPMAILCVFEFRLWSRSDRMPLRRLAGEVHSLAIYEIVVGLANTPTLVCGIILLINSGKFTSERAEEPEATEEARW